MYGVSSQDTAKPVEERGAGDRKGAAGDFRGASKVLCLDLGHCPTSIASL